MGSHKNDNFSAVVPSFKRNAEADKKEIFLSREYASKLAYKNLDREVVILATDAQITELSDLIGSMPTDIKTINGNSLLGTGNIIISEDNVFNSDGTLTDAQRTVTLLDNTTGSYLAINNSDNNEVFRADGVGNVWGDGGTGDVRNTFYGANAAPQNYTGVNGGNVGYGNYALSGITTGYNNVAVGSETLKVITTEFGNVAVGYRAGLSATSRANTLLGYRSAPSMTTGRENTFIGYLSGSGVTTGFRNIMIRSGDNLSGTGTGVTTGQRNLLLGDITGLSNPSNNVILADGDGNFAIHKDENDDIVLGTSSTTFVEGRGITAISNGTLSTDYGLIVWDEAKTRKLLNVRGDRNIYFGESGGTAENIYHYTHGGTTTDPLTSESGWNLTTETSNFSRVMGLQMASTLRTGALGFKLKSATSTAKAYFVGGTTLAGQKINAMIELSNTDKVGHWLFRTQVHLGDAERAVNTNLGTHSFIVENGTAPTEAPADSFILHSSDNGASLACPTFYFEDDTTIQLYQQSALTASNGGVADLTYDATERDLINNLKTRVDELEARLQTTGLIL